MLKFALYNYTPQRRLRKASFEEQDLSRRILLFKDGRKTATTWAANMMAQSLRLIDLSDTIIICVPASCQHTYTRRFKRFTKTLCEKCNAINGFDYVHIVGKRDKRHIASTDSVLSNILIDNDKLSGQKVLVIDDIVTTGQTAECFIKMVENAGANVRMTCFLAKTKERYRYS